MSRAQGFVAQLVDLATPAMRSGAGFHGNCAFRLFGQKRHELGAVQLLAERNRAVGAGSVNLKNLLCKIDADDANFRHVDVLPISTLITFSITASGTL